MALITLAELRRRSKSKADMVNDPFVSDQEWNDWINEEAGSVYQLLVSGFDDYRITTVDTTLVSGNTIALPSDFYRLRGLDRKLTNNEYHPVRKYNFNERGRYQNAAPGPGRISVRYRLLGQNITLIPAESAPGSYRYYYTPNFTRLVNDSDTFEDHNEWAKIVTHYAAIRGLDKEESDFSRKKDEYDAWKKELEAKASSRDEGEPERIADVRGLLSDYSEEE